MRKLLIRELTRNEYTVIVVLLFEEEGLQLYAFMTVCVTGSVILDCGENNLSI